MEAHGCSSEPISNKALGLISNTVRKERAGKAVCSVSAAAANGEAGRTSTVAILCPDKERAAIKPTGC